MERFLGRPDVSGLPERQWAKCRSEQSEEPLLDSLREEGPLSRCKAIYETPHYEGEQIAVREAIDHMREEAKRDLKVHESAWREWHMPFSRQRSPSPR